MWAAARLSRRTGGPMKTGADAEGERHAVDEMLPHGFMTLEGPVDDGDGGIVFSDVYGGGIHHLDKDGALSVLVPKRRGAGGICPHAEGGYVVTGRDVSHVKDGQTRILFAREDLPSTAADRVSGFNDILCARDGSILVGAVRQDEAGERAPGDLVRITAEHQGSIVYAGVSLPNGLGISPDGTRLYHCDTYNNRILVSRMEENRPTRIGEFSTAGTPGHPDGMAMDEAGHLWIAFHHGGCVAEYSPDGRELSRIELPVGNVLSVCFGGRDRTELFVVTHSEPEDAGNARMFRLPAKTPGLKIDPCRI
jgi:xylono-1,5-lactonase